MSLQSLPLHSEELCENNNDCVQTGAILQNDQVVIMLRFCTRQIGLVIDVEKALQHRFGQI